MNITTASSGTDPAVLVIVEPWQVDELPRAFTTWDTHSIWTRQPQWRTSLWERG